MNFILVKYFPYLLIPLVIYIFYILKFYKYYEMEYKIAFKKKLKVSIVISARNEEKNISTLLKALLSQDYDYSFIEIIIANDQSSDKTETILINYSTDYPFIKYFNVLSREYVKSPKKNALRQAISMTKGDVILLTDADCIPTSNWVSSHISMYDKYPETEMVVGFSKTKLNNIKKAKLCQQFEHLDFLILMFAAQGAIQSGHPFSCSGQNLSYKKDSYYDVNGFEGLEDYISGDDVLLMQKFINKKKEIRFAAFANSYTETIPINSWSELLNQRSRWASNFKFMYKMNFKFFVYLFSSFICLGIMPFFSTILLLLRIFFDDIFIKNALINWELDNLFSKNRPASYSIIGYNARKWLIYLRESLFLRWYLINPIYILTVTCLGIFSIFRWKDRRG